MKRWMIEYTWLVYRDELQISAETPEAARKAFLKKYPGVKNNGRVVAIRPRHVQHTTNFLARLSYARDKGKPYVVER